MSWRHGEIGCGPICSDVTGERTRGKIDENREEKEKGGGGGRREEMEEKQGPRGSLRRDHFVVSHCRIVDYFIINFFIYHK